MASLRCRDSRSTRAQAVTIAAGPPFRSFAGIATTLTRGVATSIAQAVVQTLEHRLRILLGEDDMSLPTKV